MKIHLTAKQVDDVLFAIGNWTICQDTLKQNFADKGKSLLRAEQTLLRARERNYQHSSKVEQ